MLDKKALSLLELVFVVAIISILLTIAAIGIGAYNARLELKTAQQILIQGLNTARSEAKKYSEDYSISFAENSFTVSHNETSKTYRLGNVHLNKTKGSRTLIYYAPYGKTKATNFEFELTKNGLANKVYVYGVTGKVASFE